MQGGWGPVMGRGYSRQKDKQITRNRQTADRVATVSDLHAQARHPAGGRGGEGGGRERGWKDPIAAVYSTLLPRKEGTTDRFSLRAPLPHFHQSDVVSRKLHTWRIPWSPKGRGEEYWSCTFFRSLCFVVHELRGQKCFKLALTKQWALLKKIIQILRGGGEQGRGGRAPGEIGARGL